MSNKKTNNNLRKVWLTLLFWLVGIFGLHLIARIFQFKITVLDMLISNLIVIGLILLINWFYTKEKIYFEWFGFKRIGWLWLFMFLYIVGINALFKTVPSETSLRISLDPVFWLCYILSASSISVVTFFGVLLPSMMHHFKTDHAIAKSVLLSAILYSLFQVYLLNNLYGGFIENVYQLVAFFTLGLICALLYLRCVNIMVPIFFSFIETFFAVILTHVTPIWGNGIINILFFIILAAVIFKVILNTRTVEQIRNDFKVK